MKPAEFRIRSKKRREGLEKIENVTNSAPNPQNQCPHLEREQIKKQNVKLSLITILKKISIEEKGFLQIVQT